MIQVDISNIWGQISLPDLLAMEAEVAAAHEAALEGTDKKYSQWRDLPVQEPNAQIQKLQEVADRIRKESDVCVVVGIGGSCLGSQGIITLLQGTNRNLGKRKGDPQILFTGNSLSTRSWTGLRELLQEKDISLIAISQSGTALEPAIAFRNLRWMLERKYGTEEARKRIYAVTHPQEDTLRQMAEKEGWETFPIPEGVSSPFSVLSPAGLLPLAVAGIHILELLYGAMDAKENYALGSYENPVWLYAAVRNLLYRNGKAVELLAGYEPGFRRFGAWWQQLFAQSEGKQGKGLFPVPAEFPGDLYALGQLIQQGQRNLLETVVRFDPPEKKVTIGGDWNNLDGLNYLEGKPLDFVEENACLGAIGAHADGGVPVITMDCGALNDRKAGELVYFLELCCAVSANIAGVDPFDLSGVQVYQNNTQVLLGKPASEPTGAEA